MSRSKKLFQSSTSRRGKDPRTKSDPPMPRFLPRVTKNKFYLDYGSRNIFPCRKINLDMLDSIPFPYHETFREIYTSLKSDEEGGDSAFTRSAIFLKKEFYFAEEMLSKSFLRTLKLSSHTMIFRSWVDSSPTKTLEQWMMDSSNKRERNQRES